MEIEEQGLDPFPLPADQLAMKKFINYEANFSICSTTQISGIMARRLEQRNSEPCPVQSTRAAMCSS
jgi:hypothetical protein